jgi:UDP-glucose:(heptosyl)LPS alpha-1,3-glucosyltransferase
MRFLLSLYRYFSAGGLQMDSLRIARNACQRGHQVVFCTTRWEGPRPEDLPGLEIKLLPEPKAWTNLARLEQFGKMIAEERARGHYDGEIAMNRFPGAEFYFAADECMKDLIYHQRRLGRLLLLFPRYRTLLRLEKETLFCPETKKILLLSQRQLQDFQREYGLPTERFLMLPPGMDPGSLPPASQEEQQRLRQQERHSLGIQDDELLLLMVGTGLYRKGADRYLAAVAALPEDLRKRCRAAIIGRDSPDAIQSLARKAGLPHENLIVLPPRPSVGALYLAADLLVHAARSEGSGTILVEAEANGLPVLCTAICGFSNFVEPTGMPVIPEPFRQEALNQALKEVLPNLPEHAKRTCEYAATQDFCRRTDAIVDLLEGKEC